MTHNPGKLYDEDGKLVRFELELMKYEKPMTKKCCEKLVIDEKAQE